MQNETLHTYDVTTGDVHPFEAIPIPRTTSRLTETSDIHRKVQILVPQAAESRRRELVSDWEDLRHRQAAKDGQTLLSELSERGMAWRDVARLVGVSVPAVQKWRRGAGITGENRLRLAGVCAVLHCLDGKLINEPVSWLEMPVLIGAAVTSMDLLVGERYDLVLELAADDPLISPDRTNVLDEFDPDWRSTRVDETFEVFEAQDGSLSIRPRR